MKPKKRNSNKLTRLTTPSSLQSNTPPDHSAELHHPHKYPWSSARLACIICRVCYHAWSERVGAFIKRSMWWGRCIASRELLPQKNSSSANSSTSLENRQQGKVTSFVISCRNIKTLHLNLVQEKQKKKKEWVWKECRRVEMGSRRWVKGGTEREISLWLVKSVVSWFVGDKSIKGIYLCLLKEIQRFEGFMLNC